MNKYRFNIQPGNRYLNIPIEIKTDLLGRDDLINKFEDETIEKVINPIEDFEVTRYAHRKYENENKTSLNYEFLFFDRSIDVETTNSGSQDLWVSDYVFTDNPNFTGTCFNEAEIYYNANSFKRSFFKLDLYDTTDTETQQIYLTLIIPTQQGKTRLSSTTPISTSGGFVQGPLIPDVIPEGGFSSGLRQTISESTKIYKDAVTRITLENSKKQNEKETKINVKNLAYHEQLKYELSESAKRAYETLEEVNKKSTDEDIITPTPSQSTLPLPTPNVTPSPTQSINIDMPLNFNSYEVTFENCNSQALTKYISVSLWNNAFDWPTYGYSKNFDGVCYEITNANTSVQIPDPPIEDWIDSYNGFVNNNCGCITPTPSRTPTPTPTPLPQYTMQIRTPAPIGYDAACEATSPNLTVTYYGALNVGTKLYGYGPVPSGGWYGKIFNSDEPNFQYNDYLLVLTNQFGGGDKVAQLYNCNIPDPTPTPTPSSSYLPPSNEGGVNPNPEGVGSGATPTLSIAPANAQIKLPNFVLDYIGDKEGFFIYWLKDPNYIKLDKLYMGAKFFNAKTGQFTRFMNRTQSNFSNKFNFEKSKDFYYEVSLDIDNYEYSIKDVVTGQRIGEGSPIKWYEYVNPS